MTNAAALLFIISVLNFGRGFSQGLSPRAHSIAETGLTCIDNNDMSCAINKFEKLLSNYGNEMNYQQKATVIDVLRNCYYNISVVQAQNDNPGFKTYCLKGIDLGEKIGKQYDLNAFMFHYLMIVYYYTLENELQFNNWVIKFNDIKNNLYSEYLDSKGKSEIISWANNNISKMEEFFSTPTSGTSISFSVGNLFSGFSSSGKPVISNNAIKDNNNNSHIRSSQSSKNEKNYIYIYLEYSDGHPASNVEIRLQECGSYGTIGDDKANTDANGYAKIYNYDPYFACGIFAKGKKYKKELQNGRSYTITLQ